jgi:hypothetical protein
MSEGTWEGDIFVPPEKKIVYVKQRRICWPNPDATCLEGGCIYCGLDGRWVNFGTIAAWAREAGQVPNRYGGATQGAQDAWREGLREHFYQADPAYLVREVPKLVEA